MDEPSSDFDTKLDVLREKYIARCRRRVASAKDWLHASEVDFEVVGRLHAMAHELAGSGATYGFPDITLAAEHIEHFLDPVADRGESITDEARSADLSAMLERLEEALPS